MSRPDYRIGLLGASRIAPMAVIQPALRRSDCKIAAIACRDVERGRDYAAEHGVPDADIVEDYEALCARDDIDIVYNALPPSRHLDLSRAAAGKVQLIEKPFALNAAEAREIAALPGTIMEAFHHRYHPAFARFLAEVDRVRPLTRMEGRFHVTIPDRPGELRHDAALGGGSLMDLGTYPLQIARTLAGREPVVARADAVEGRPRVDLRIEAQLDFGEGLAAVISSDMSEGVQRLMMFQVTGTGGTVRMDNPIHPYRGCRITTPDETLTNDDHPRWSAVTTYDAQLAHLILCLSMGTPPLTDAPSAVKQMEAIDAIYEKSGLGPR
ncbi:MAG: Gfo/Idh/MocA family oxidoreductase [Litorimonas sp.]